ncbi:MAG: M6 family metalloprotease domain-containing protein [Cyclobacteriaceae bacterium]
MPLKIDGEQFTFTQPNGEKFEVRLWGNQYYATIETLDGYTIAQDPQTRYYHYASEQEGELIPSDKVVTGTSIEANIAEKHLRNRIEVSKSLVYQRPGLAPGNSRWRQRREEAKIESTKSAITMAPAPPLRQPIGDYIGLCLLIEFPDVRATIPRDEIDLYCNEQGYGGFGNNGSVYDYFYDNSRGKLRYSNTVTHYYTAPRQRSYYTDESIQYGVRATELIREALTSLRNQGTNLQHLTSDSQDYIYALNVFYAGDVVNNWAKGLWPHCHHLNAPFPLANNKLVFDYQITNVGSALSLATFCHENGHMVCDFPDLYDYGNDSSGVGQYCLMCMGGNANYFNPTQVCAYLKYKAGWIDRITAIPSGVANHQLEAGKNQFIIFRKDPTEYFIVENRFQAGRDMSLPDSGLAIWHVDELGNNNNEQRSPQLHYECSLIQADGLNHLERAQGYGDMHDLFDNTSNRFANNTNPPCKWWDGSLAHLEIYNISAPGTQVRFSSRL